MSGVADLPQPSAVRRVVLDARGNSYSNISPAASRFRWPAKHPLDVDWWWVDATRWCKDIGDTIAEFAPSNVLISGGDGTLCYVATAVSGNGKWVGVRWTGGTSGQNYIVTVILSGSLGADIIALDIAFPCRGAVGSPAPPAPDNPGPLVDGGVLTGNIRLQSGDFTAAGTDQETAPVLTDQVCFVIGGVPGAGVRAPLQSDLPTGTTIGDITIINQTPNAISLYPPTGGYFMASGTDLAGPVGVSPGAQIRIFPTNIPEQWRI